MKSFKEFINEDLIPTAGRTEVGDVLRCIWPGRVSITRGDEARSADADKGDMFTVTDVDRNKNWIFGKLEIKGKFVRDAGLSGKDPERLKNLPIPSSGIEYAILRDYIDGNPEDDFWACWETIDQADGLGPALPF